MKKIIPSLLIGLFLLSRVAFAQDTFSICAIDPFTGEVGSAGASCIANCIIISDVHPGVGVVHTQSYWLANNKAYCQQLMNQGFSPQAILDSVTANDYGMPPDSSIRQYGAVDLVGGGRSASFTGSGCLSYANHINQATYAIQGNILLGQQILDSMEARFNAAPGPLANKLMAAMQGANVPGADTRCLANGKPAISAFLRVATPGDTNGTFTCDIRVNNTAAADNPIDSLQVLFDQFCAATATIKPAEPASFRIFPNPSAQECWIEATVAGFQQCSFSVYDVNGRIVREAQFRDTDGRIKLNTCTWEAGLYVILFQTPNGHAESHTLAVQH